MLNNTYYKKIIIGGSTFIIILLIAYIYAIQVKHNQITACHRIISQEENITDKGLALNTYTNKPLGYKLLYPNNLDVTSLENNGVAFSQGGGPGISIQIFPKQQFPNEAAWLEAENKKLKSSRYFKDGDITIAGQKGVSVHEATNNGENFPNPQTIIFTKGDKLFVVTSPLEQIPMVMDSFYFVE